MKEIMVRGKKVKVPFEDKEISHKLQAASATKRTQLKNRIKR